MEQRASDTNRGESLGRGMRIALFLPFLLDPESSVGIKAHRMLRTWSDLGAEVRGFTLSATGATPEGWTALRSRTGEIARQLGARRLATEVAAWSPDVVYTRFFLWVPGLRSRLGVAPVVEEVNTNDRGELPLWSRRASLYNSGTRAASIREREGFVFLTDELARITGLASSGAPWCTVSNGIDLDAIEALPAPVNTRPRAAFLAGTDSVWQGTDKVLRLAALCPTIDIDVIGVDVDGLVPHNVKVHPYVVGTALCRRLARADIALGTLALHRKHMEEACPLKVRECLSHGIPTVIGYTDPDLVGMDDRYVLRIENTEDNVEHFASVIARFAAQSVGVRVPRTAIDGLSSRRKEEQRLDFLRSIAAAT